MDVVVTAAGRGTDTTTCQPLPMPTPTNCHTHLPHGLPHHLYLAPWGWQHWPVDAYLARAVPHAPHAHTTCLWPAFLCIPF